MMQEMTLDTLFAQGQIRLSEISLFNWGSFHNLHTARIDPEGTLITGDNGAGKSTFIDGLMALLQPAHKVSFNVAAAQNNRSDRSLLSYMRGSYGSEHDGSGTRIKSKRDKAVTTALRALYTAEDGSTITLIGLFWITQGGNSLGDVNRLYMIASRNVLLTEVLDIFAEGNTRQLKQHFNPKLDARIHYFDSKFEDYQERYRKYLFMDNQNAPALLSRALGLKKIDDLTKLIRELVLEPSQIRELAKMAVNEFEDLEANYRHITDTREQVEHLRRLPGLAAEISTLTEKLTNLHLEKQALPAYLGELFVQYWLEKISELEQEIEHLKCAIQQIEQQEKDAERTVERCHEDYIQLGGGQIEKLQQELQHIKQQLSLIHKEASRYQGYVRQVGLSDELTEQSLIQNQKQAQIMLSNIDQVTQQRQEELGVASATFANSQQQLKNIRSDLQHIKSRPESNIYDLHLLRLRDELNQELNFTEHELMFIGELIDVKEEEKAWQGAIERALGGLRTTLLVPKDRYSMVTKWVNTRDNKTHVRLQVVDLNHNKATQFTEKGFLRKLIWREHRYRDWLKQHLLRFDLQCVSDTAALDITPFSMTQQGLMHLEFGRFEKKDRQRIDDQKFWCLGFSNQARLKLLENEEKQLNIELEQHETLLLEARTRVDEVTHHKILWKALLDYQWESINLSYWVQRQQQLVDDLEQLQKAGTDTEIARQRWEQAKQSLKQFQDQKGTLQQNQGQLDQKLKDALQKQQQAQQDADQGVDEVARQLLIQRIGTTPKLVDHLSIQIGQELDHLITQTNSLKNSTTNTALGIMVSFRSKEKWAHLPLQREWAPGLAALDDYIAYLEELEKDGLPALVEQFERRLQKHTTQSLSVIEHRWNAARDEIIDRIGAINQVLQRTEFRAGSYLRLGCKREKYPHVLEFERKLKLALSHINHSEYEFRFQKLADVISILDRASSSSTANNLESLRLLDPRYQMSFYAEEVDAQSGDIRDVLESSSGKSGGEKEAFAGTIVAASLAYVLTPDGYDYPIYSTVFLDEAFSNTAEAVSRRVLRVFKALKIHVNLITPYKNLNLARESARSLLIAERDISSHESHLCEVTWKDIDEKLKRNRQQLHAEAEQLGIQINV